MGVNRARLEEGGVLFLRREHTALEDLAQNAKTSGQGQRATRGQGAKKHLGVEQIAVHGLGDDLRHLPVFKFDEGEMLAASQ